MKILVTGGNGQLGQELKVASRLIDDQQFYFTERGGLDITDQSALKAYFGSINYDACINCAAYTAVDLAETERERAFEVNKEGAKNIAEICQQKKVKLIHVSTDFVFDGKQNVPYKERDVPNPIGVYGQSKYQGEQAVMESNQESIIIRTSWLYSSFGKNFVKTIAKLCLTKDNLGVVYDQVGAPTYAADLAETIIQLLIKPDLNWNPGIYHYANEGVASWYDFAIEIVASMSVKCQVNPIETWQYPTAAIRPPYTVFHKQKIKDYLQMQIPYWKTSLDQCMGLIKEEQKL